MAIMVVKCIVLLLIPLVFAIEGDPDFYVIPHDEMACLGDKVIFSCGVMDPYDISWKINGSFDVEGDKNVPDPSRSDGRRSNLSHTVIGNADIECCKFLGDIIGTCVAARLTVTGCSVIPTPTRTFNTSRFPNTGGSTGVSPVFTTDISQMTTFLPSSSFYSYRPYTSIQGTTSITSTHTPATSMPPTDNAGTVDGGVIGAVIGAVIASVVLVVLVVVLVVVVICCYVHKKNTKKTSSDVTFNGTTENSLHYGHSERSLTPQQHTENPIPLSIVSQRGSPGIAVPTFYHQLPNHLKPFKGKVHCLVEGGASDLVGDSAVRGPEEKLVLQEAGEVTNSKTAMVMPKSTRKPRGSANRRESDVGGDGDDGSLSDDKIGLHPACSVTSTQAEGDTQDDITPSEDLPVGKQEEGPRQ